MSIRRSAFVLSDGEIRLSKAGKKRYTKLSGFEFSSDVKCVDPYLVQTVRELGKAAGKGCANLRIAFIVSDDATGHMTIDEPNRFTFSGLYMDTP
jgi:hypothetical protein